MFLYARERPECLLSRAPKIIKNASATAKCQHETCRHVKSLSRICVTLRTSSGTILCTLGHLAECTFGGACERLCESLSVRNVDLGCLQWFSNGLRRFLNDLARFFTAIHMDLCGNCEWTFKTCLSVNISTKLRQCRQSAPMCKVSFRYWSVA